MLIVISVSPIAIPAGEPVIKNTSPMHIMIELAKPAVSWSIS
jgi:hypothetical protein